MLASHQGVQTVSLTIKYARHAKRASTLLTKPAMSRRRFLEATESILQLLVKLLHANHLDVPTASPTIRSAPCARQVSILSIKLVILRQPYPQDMESTQPSLIKFLSASLKDALIASQITRHARFVIRPVATHCQDLLAYRQYQTVKAGTMLALF